MTPRWTPSAPEPIPVGAFLNPLFAVWEEISAHRGAVRQMVRVVADEDDGA
jgi:hypothetical protein